HPARPRPRALGPGGQAGNGIQIFDPASSIVRVLEGSPTEYSALTWRQDSSDLLALKAKTDDKHDGPTQVLLTWRSVGQSGEKLKALDPTAAGVLPATQRIVTFRRPSWMVPPAGSEPMILLGVAEWPAKPAPAPGQGGRGAGGAGAATPTPTAAPSASPTMAPTPTPSPVPEKADVDVWHWNDTTVRSAQKLSVAADRRRNLPAVWHVDSNKFVVIGKSFDESVGPVRGTTRALVGDFGPYLMEGYIAPRAS